MFQLFTQLIKWIAIPVLLFASMLSYFAARYEPLLTGVVILGAIFFVGRAVQLRQFSWAVGLVTIIVAFSPLFLMIKVFLFLGMTCIAAFTGLFAAFRTQPLPGREHQSAAQAAE